MRLHNDYRVQLQCLTAWIKRVRLRRSKWTLIGIVAVTPLVIYSTARLWNISQARTHEMAELQRLEDLLWKHSGAAGEIARGLAKVELAEATGAIAHERAVEIRATLERVRQQVRERLRSKAREILERKREGKGADSTSP